MVRVRFAPSPTGIPHIGSTRTALFNFLFAKVSSGEFYLRIEDTDQNRFVKDAEEAIYESLSWLGLDYDGEIIHQSKRLDIYKKYANDLLLKKLAYEKEGAIWINVGDEKIFEWTDLVGNKKISFKGKDVEDFVIIKSDGFPTYHFANVIDDHLTDISHVLRGEEWTSSTPKHLYIYELFEWNPPKFAHLPVILASDKTKLSKRHGAKSALDYKKEGYIKEAILNYTALLGWNPGSDREKMTIDEMISAFKLEDINTANPIFDQKKFEWLNGLWIRSIQDLDKRLEEFYKDDRDVQNTLNGESSKQIINAASTRMRTLADFKNLVSFQSSHKKTKEEKEIAKKLIDKLSNLGNKWKDDGLLLGIKEFSREEKVPFKIIFLLMTGKEQGIGILELNRIFGKDFFLKNLQS